MCTDQIIKCHNSLPLLNEKKCTKILFENVETSSSPLMTFRVKKCGRVEAEKATNLWAGQCQSKVNFFFKLKNIFKLRWFKNY